MTEPLGRRALAEYLGSAWLVTAVVGSGIMAERLSADDGVRLLANAAATVGPLICVILMFGGVSGAHFNPIVTLAAVARRSLPAREWPAYTIAQLAGACSGAIVANLMFDLAPVTASTKVRSGAGIWLGEVVATTGLLLVIHLVGLARATWTPVAVGIWIGGAYWFTSSTSLANPAVTIARSLTDTFTGIAPGSVAAFIASQFAGLVAALLITHALDAER
ncbi:MAG: aquaporin [Gemmatimonadota bacterium]